jgi:hypothetical protein
LREKDFALSVLFFRTDKVANFVSFLGGGRIWPKPITSSNVNLLTVQFLIVFVGMKPDPSAARPIISVSRNTDEIHCSREDLAGRGTMSLQGNRCAIRRNFNLIFDCDFPFDSFGGTGLGNLLVVVGGNVTV